MRSARMTASSMLYHHDEHGLESGSSLASQRRSSSVRRFCAVSTSRAENGSSISSASGSHHERPGEADTLAHPAGQLLGIGRFEAVEPDPVDDPQNATFLARRRTGLSARGYSARPNGRANPVAEGQADRTEYHRQDLAQMRLAQQVQDPAPGAAADSDRSIRNLSDQATSGWKNGPLHPDHQKMTITATAIPTLPSEPSAMAAPM